MRNLKQETDNALKNAMEAFPVYKATSGKKKAKFLRLIAEEIDLLGDRLIETVMKETFLPEARVRGEKSRTTGQLNKFADLLEDGSWVEAIIDTGDLSRSPAPKPDLRKMLIPLGPVVVFGAGNFPLAFSVAGGDTASALAGGNPVIVKGHPAHPETGKMVAEAIKNAVRKANVPEGVFELIQDEGIEAGKMLVVHPGTKAVSFTGSYSGGKALTELAAQRPEPIPVFAEMGSINPVVILEGALKNQAASIAEKLVASVNLNAGQFCTNPGLIITTQTEGFNLFIKETVRQISSSSGSKMFSESVLRNYRLNSGKMLEYSDTKIIAKGSEEPGSPAVGPIMAMVAAKDFINRPALHEEVFGPFSLVVVCDSEEQLKQVISSLRGQLTATIFSDKEDNDKQKEITSALLDKCGRLLFNGVPTGVEVCAAMQHGGPYPASSDSRYTSVGVSAIKRFVRPVSFQDFPDDVLPDELKNNNPLDIWRFTNNQWTKDKI